MYLYPMYFAERSDRTILAASRKIVPYLDLPLQHINDRCCGGCIAAWTGLKRSSSSPGSGQQIEGLALRTTLITGFPGETEEQFEELVDFVRTQRFERLGAFIYSREPGTPADRLDGHLPEKVKRARRQRLLAVQQEIAFAWNAAKVSQPLDVLIDGYVPDAEDAYLGRSYADAPEIDGSVYVTGENLAPGRIVPCEVVAFRDYDLVAVAVGPPR